MLTQEITVKVSPIYTAFLSIFVFASLIVVAALQLDWRLKALIFIGVAIYGAQLIWRYALLKGRDSIIAMRPVPEKGWVITTRLQRYDATLCKDSTVTSVVAVLRFKVAGRRFPLNSVLFRDSLNADEYRELVVLARHR